MCGFTGCFSFNQINSTNLKKGNNLAICRGPDNQKNLYGNDEINYNLWFNRLSIVDLNENANQPMSTPDSSSIILFNGEIFNSDSLRKSNYLRNYNFQTSHSDTETLLAGLDIYGINLVHKLEGQFAFVYWNKNLKKIFLCRDRFGQKPLYYNFQNQNIYFASNLRSLVISSKQNELNLDNISQYLGFGTSFSPDTIFKNIFKVNPGSYIEIDYSNLKFKYKNKTYWKPESMINDYKFNQEEFVDIFSKSVQKRLVSDVPIATFLSGGIDSSSIVKNLNDQGNKINTFSVVVDDKNLNEKKYIEEVKSKYNTNHQEITINKNINQEDILKSLNSLDEPYGDPSVVLSYLISRLISKDYKVAISGDGGDELLGGYSRMKNFMKNRNLFTDLYFNLYKIYPAFLGTGTRFKSYSRNYQDAHRAFLEDEKFVKLMSNQTTLYNKKVKFTSSHNEYKSAVINEYKYYLSDQMLFKVDRTSMANSLEVRSPFLDHQLVEYILKTNPDYVFKNNPKAPLYDYLAQDFDSDFLNRPKQGFIFNYKDWIYDNSDLVVDVINSSELSNYVEINNLNSLFKIKTRINALRIWRIFVLSNYLVSIKSL